MRFVPRIDVKTQVIAALVLAIATTWVASTGVEHYLTYRQLLAYRAEMAMHPELYSRPIAEPMFGVEEFFIGYPARLPAPDRPVAPSASSPTTPSMDTLVREGPQPLSQEQIQAQAGNLLFSTLMALAIAVVFGLWMSLLFTRPLSALLKAARSMGDGQFSPEIQIRGAGEFAELGQTLRFLGDRVSTQIGDLKRETQTRRQFLADLAHEFRTPLTTLKTMAGALEDGLAENPVRRERAIASIVRTADRLLRLVTDMLELARLDLHELPLSLQSVDAKELAASCLASQLDQAAAAGVFLDAVPPGPPLLVRADPDRLAQIFDNLLSNAIAYAGPGARVDFRFDDGSPVRLAVSDTGRGIASQHLPYLGEAFYRADAARSPSEKHSGLGLRIVRALVEAQGGRFTIRSEENRGTTAEFTLMRPTSEGSATER